MIRLLCFLSVLLLATSGVRADEYWIAYEGNDFPENQGGRRIWGNQQGLFQGPGATRTLNNGVLTIDSLFDTSVFDFYDRQMNGQLDPDPAELFVMQWRLKVDQVIGFTDPTVGMFSDERRVVAFDFDENTLFSGFESGVSIPIEPGVFHEYGLRSWDMLTYELFIDRQLVREGVFVDVVSESFVGWGDGVQGAASLSEWDYFRFGVVPEPGGALLFALALTSRRVSR